ncbi:MAG: hypothetical protein OES47_09615 [Acidobacteriota bacterium]|nr:hypothetical protein [Acidobacteriota bacterium]
MTSNRLPNRPTPAAASFVVLAAIFATLFVAPIPSGGTTACSYFHNYIGQNPRGDSPGWHKQAQGVAHDETHWYLSQKNRIWRIPVEQDLRISPPLPPPFGPLNPKPHVRCEGSDPLPWADSIEVPCAGLPDELTALGRDHFGDLSVHDGFLFVPIDGNDGTHIGVFRADKTLTYVGAALLDLESLGWLAIDPEGKLYLSRAVGTHQTFEVYGLDWNLLVSHGEVEIGYLHELLVRDELDQRAFLTRMQGGVFSDDGRQLYLVNGFTDEDDSTPDDEDDWGIHVFEVTPKDPDPACTGPEEGCLPIARRVARSTNGTGPFNFQFNPGYFTRQEPEGVTYWDLDAPGAPEAGGKTSLGLPVGGQLHVMMLNNNDLAGGFPSADEVYLKHYTAEVACDPAPGLRVIPRGIDFGEVGVKDSRVEILELRNEGDAALAISDLTLMSEGGHFGFPSMPVPPIVLPPNTSASLLVEFAPTEGGDLSGAVTIESDDPDDPLLIVPLAGIGRTLIEQAQDLVAAFDEAVAFGSLSGVGPGRSAENRLETLGSMLEEAALLLEAGFIEEACGQLHAAFFHVDGTSTPSDFVAGPAAEEFAQAIRDLRERLDCGA